MTRTLAGRYFLATIALSSIAISLLLAEVALAFFWPQPLSTSFRLVDADGLHLNRAIGSARHQYGQNRDVVYRFNEFHQRGAPVDFSRPRILVLGDSFTFGWLLEEADTYVALLQSLADTCTAVRQYQFLNGAAAGWGTDSYLRYLERFGEQLRPDYVLVFINIDDIDRAFRSGLYALNQTGLHFTPRPENISQLKRVLNSIPGYDFLLARSNLMQLLRKAHRIGDRYFKTEKKGPPVTSSMVAEEDAALALALFSRMNAWCLQHNCRLLVTTTGTFTAESASRATANFLNVAPDFFAAAGIPYFDSAPAIHTTFARKGRDAFFIPDDGHPNERGARLIAHTVWPWLRSEILPDCAAYDGLPAPSLRGVQVRPP